MPCQLREFGEHIYGVVCFVTAPRTMHHDLCRLCIVSEELERHFQKSVSDVVTLAVRSAWRRSTPCPYQETLCKPTDMCWPSFNSPVLRSRPVTCCGIPMIPRHLVELTWASNTSIDATPRLVTAGIRCSTRVAS